jgi:hypothetical protein
LQKINSCSVSRTTHAHAIAIGHRHRVAVIIGIRSGFGVTARSIASAAEGHRARPASLVANVVATETIDAVVAHALAGHGARSTIQASAHAGAIAFISIVARHRPGIIGLRIGHVLTSANKTRSIAGLACFGARRGATNAVDAKSAGALTSIIAWRPVHLGSAAAGTHAPAITIPIGTLILGIIAIENRQARTITATSQCTRTGPAELIADVVATKSIDAVPTQTLRGHGAIDAVEGFAGSTPITSIRIVARHCARGIDRIVGNERTYADRAREIARFAGIAARRITTNTVGAETARAFPIHAAGLAIVTFAGAHSIAGVRPGTERHIVAVGGHVCTHALGTGHIARLAFARARFSATNPIRAESRDARHAIRAAASLRNEACAQTITYGSSILRARRIERKKHMQRRTIQRAAIRRAFEVVVEDVEWINGRNDVARTVAYVGLAIPRHLLRNWRAWHSIGNLALPHGARVCFTLIAGSAVGRHCASSALTGAIARQCSAAIKSHRFGRIRWRSIRTNIFCTNIVIVRNIGIVGLLGQHPSRTTSLFLAVTFRRGDVDIDEIHHTTHVVRACSLLAWIGRYNGRTIFR